MTQHDYHDLITLFNSEFSEEYHTRLICGEDEPLYLPATATVPYHQIIFAHGFYASALHEISHWCIAGAERRQRIDYGYWYCPDGRTQAQQAAFEAVEIKPQALDWLFCTAARFRFNVSCDNLHGTFTPDRVAFQNSIREQVIDYLAHGLPPRAAQFLAKLHQFYQTEPCKATDFALITR